MFLGHIGQEPVAQQSLWQTPRVPERAEHPVTPGAVALLQFVNDDLASGRHHVNDGAPLKTFGQEASATCRTHLGSRHALGAGDFPRSGRAAATAESMARFHVPFFFWLSSRVLGLTASLAEKGLRSRRGFSGVAFLIAETVFEPGIFFFEAINLPAACPGSRDSNEGGAGSSRFGSCGTVGAAQSRAEGKEELFQCGVRFGVPDARVGPGLWESYMQFGGGGCLGEGEDAKPACCPPGAGGTVFTDAGLFDESQRSFERRPERGQLGEKPPLRARAGSELGFHVVCILYHIHTCQRRKCKK